MNYNLMPLLTAPLVLEVITCNPVPKNCKAWSSNRFFEEASSDDVSRCLARVSDPNPRDWDAFFSELPAPVNALLEAGDDVNARNK